MTDDKSPDDFEEYLRKKKWTYDRKGPVSNLHLFLVKDYEVPFGQNTGKKIQIIFPIPIDYAATAPYVIHVQNNHGLLGNISNVAPSSLGEVTQDYQFWSRTIANWSQGYRSAQYYIDNVNRWLEL